MKKYFTAMLLAMLALTDAQAANNDYDENPGGWNFELPMLEVKSAHKNKVTVKGRANSFLSFGFITGVSQARDVSIDMGQSYEIEWGNVIATRARIGRKDFLRIGLGFDWRNYRVTGFKRFAKDEQGIITMQDYPEGTEPKFSRIHTFSLSVPLKYYHYFNRKIYFALGPELYITPHGSLKTRYYEGNRKRKLTESHVHQNRFSVGVGAEINIHHIGIYYKYNPFNVLQSNYGPKFSSMTVGLKLAL